MQKILSRSEYNFFTTASTRWRDSDTLGHINHTIYLSILETAHKDFLIHMYGEEKLPLDFDSTSAGLLASMQVMYIEQSHHPAKFDVGFRITRVGTKSYDVHEALFLKGEDTPVFQSIHTFVMFNFKEQKSIPVDDIVKENLQEIE